jgi:hypothetical protein
MVFHLSREEQLKYYFFGHFLNTHLNIDQSDGFINYCQLIESVSINSRLNYSLQIIFWVVPFKIAYLLFWFERVLTCCKQHNTTHAQNGIIFLRCTFFKGRKPTHVKTFSKGRLPKFTLVPKGNQTILSLCLSPCCTMSVCLFILYDLSRNWMAIPILFLCKIQT